MKKMKIFVAVVATMLAVSCKKGNVVDAPVTTIEQQAVNAHIWPDSAKQDWKGLVYVHQVVEIKATKVSKS
ncbi:hypothetical protein LX64_02431 [Chitinophaga skermanii]|uniref:Uncharacterized protein n=1 Tax=Chitinophaga skermanii TaxID=331697 RepID=A0A327QKU6_9BACT|nr:hypothetical protein [Chitinophaga skermanii]RAJ05276.1 hypothetical protein LX64_02431 [Chitinophaga skermanii]